MNRLVIKIYHKFPADYQKKIKNTYLFLTDNKFYKIIKKFLRKFFIFLDESCRFYMAWVVYEVIWSSKIKNKIDNINFFERKIYSQNGEDGLIEMIFKKIGTTNKFSVEFGVYDGRECNSRYLREKKGWSCLQMDGMENNAEHIKKEYITAENINSLFKKYNVPAEFDLLSVDIDYNTYWVWKAIENYKPRVVIVEYNSSIPPGESKTVPYNPNLMWDGTNYFGASLSALAKLGKSKGYTLIGCENRGVNSFFVRDDLVNDNFVIKDVTELYRSTKNKWWEEDGPEDSRLFISV